MAAYAAVVSLFNTLEHIKEHAAHSHVPISIDKDQIESLGKIVTCLIDFLEAVHSKSVGSNDEVRHLERRIRDAAYAATDGIESHVAKQLLLARYANKSDARRASTLLHKAVQKVIKEMDSIKKKVKKIKEKCRRNQQIQSTSKLHILVGKLMNWQRISSVYKSMGFDDYGSESSSHVISNLQTSTSHPTANNTRSVGFEDNLIQIMERLMGQKPNLEIITIAGMGGIGKTTLARNAYENPTIVEYFHRRAWVFISQEFNVKKVLLGLLYLITGKQATETLESFVCRKSSVSTEDEIGQELYKCLCGWRYLIVMDDVWSIEAWNEFKCFFPNNNNGSRILMTTRLSNIAAHVGSFVFQMQLLDEDNGWSLLHEKVFGQGVNCPPELVEVGKKISSNCRGLPLSLVVIGGLLAKSVRTIDYWEYVAENINFVVNSENDGHCLKILSLSYNELPIHLKPCFLYLSAFPEDHKIKVSELIKSWVTIGFLKPSGSKSLEEVGKDCLKELIDRNLVLVRSKSWSQSIKTCMIHDCLRDLCSRQANKEQFRHASKRSSYFDISNFYSAFKRFRCSSNRLENLERNHLHPQSSLSEMVGERYLTLTIFGRFFEGGIFHPLMSLYWNLQILIVPNFQLFVAPFEIWEMPQLRHVEFFSLILPDPPIRHKNDGDCVLKNLHRLQVIERFNCSEEVIKKIPNIKKLGIGYRDSYASRQPNLNPLEYGLHNLVHLCKLESLSLCTRMFIPYNRRELVHSIVFPCSLKRLKLEMTRLPWEDMTIISSLPCLEVLKLRWDAFIGEEWNPTEGGFSSLKLLCIQECSDLRHWTADAAHFPSLTRLVLNFMLQLEEIPPQIGEAPTLRSIVLRNCSDSAVISAKNILEYQQEFGNEDLLVEVFLRTKLEISPAKNFLVHK